MIKNSGFTFIEISFGLLISSLLVLMLFQVQGSLFRLTRRIDAELAYMHTVPILLHQMERDFSAILVPEPIYEQIAKKLKSKKRGNEGEVPEGEKQEKLQSEKSPESPDKKKEASIDWDKVQPFFCKKQDASIILSCITTSARPLFQRSNKRLVRVVYSIEPESEDISSYLVKRAETEDLFEEDPAVLLKNSFVLARGLRSCIVRLIAPSTSTAEESGAVKKGDLEKTEIRALPTTTLDSWEFDVASEAYVSLLPLAIELDAVWQKSGVEGSWPCVSSVSLVASLDVLAQMELLRARVGGQQKNQNSPADNSNSFLNNKDSASLKRLSGQGKENAGSVSRQQGGRV